MISDLVKSMGGFFQGYVPSKICKYQKHLSIHSKNYYICHETLGRITALREEPHSAAVATCSFLVSLESLLLDERRIHRILPCRAVSCSATFRNRVAVTNHAAVVVPLGNYSLAYGGSALRPRNLGGVSVMIRHNTVEKKLYGYNTAQ